MVDNDSDDGDSDDGDEMSWKMFKRCVSDSAQQKLIGYAAQEVDDDDEEEEEDDPEEELRRMRRLLQMDFCQR